MDKYIGQLIDDMREAAKNLPPVPDYDLPEEMECLQGVMEWENGEEKPMQEWIGIEKKQFPPADKLNDVQIKLMVGEILSLWETYNFHPTFPENLPDRLAYDLLVNYFEEPIQWVSQGMCGIEFCEYDPEHCPYPQEYCMCNEIPEQNKRFDDIGNYRELHTIKTELKYLDKSHPQKFILSILMDWKMEKLLKKAINSIQHLQSLPEYSDETKTRSRGHFDEIEFAPGIEKVTGISRKEFPNYKYLNGYQIRKILAVLLELLNVIRVKVKFYKGLPLELKYQYLVDSWINEPLQLYSDIETEWDELPIIPGIYNKDEM